MQDQELWLLLWRRIGARGDPVKIYDELIMRYAETHRAYHTIEHIERCLGELGQAAHLADNPEAIEFALWFHDAAYDPKAENNEEQSAVLALETMRNASLPDTFRYSVIRLILATKHLNIPADIDSQLIVDIDLSILGQSAKKFDEYERRIRKEYVWVLIDAFAARRSAILRSFLARQNIYSTQFFRDKYEAQARRNIARSLEKLLPLIA